MEEVDYTKLAPVDLTIDRRQGRGTKRVPGGPPPPPPQKGENKGEERLNKETEITEHRDPRGET